MATPEYLGRSTPHRLPRRIIEHLRADLRRIRTKDSFARNAFTIFSGNSLVLLSQLVLTPTIARIYGPEVYGIYGLFSALVINLASISDLGYSTAYVLPKDDREHLHLLRLNLFLLSVVTLVALVGALLREQVYQLVPDWRPLGPLVLLLPLGLAGYGCIYFFTQSLTRHKAFRTSVLLGTTTTVTTRAANLIYGLLSKGALMGMIIGEVAINAISSVFYWVAMQRYGIGALMREWDWKALRAVAIAYRRYPLLTFPERWVAQLSGQLPIFLLIEDPEVVGWFALSTSLLAMPLRLLGYSLNNVYIQKAASTVESAPEELGRLTRGLHLRLFWIGLPAFAVLTFFSDWVFAFIMGEAWRGAGVITGFMGLFYLFRLTSEPISTLFYAQRKEHRLLGFQLGLGAARLAAMGAALYAGLSAGHAILAFAMASAAGYLFLGHWLLRSAGQDANRLAWSMLAYTALVGALMAAARWAILGDPWPKF